MSVTDSASSGLEWLSSGAAPSVLLGLWARALGLMFAWACGTLVPQIRALAGSRGIQPAQTRILRIHTDFPLVARFYRFPSLLHLGASLSPGAFDWLLQLLLVVGALSGLVAALGVGDSRIALFVCWAIYLSYANMVQLLIYPWDYMLMEASFLSLFLPSLQPLWVSLSLTSAPLPVVSWSLRWLLFRLMIGFGRIKFQGASTKEFSYLKGFMINQPLPNYLGWLLYSMPLWVHKLGLAAFFVSEIIVPFGFVFCGGSTRALCALATIVLQVHIQAAGNFGFFNLLSALLCLPCLDGHSALLADFAWSDVAAAPFTHLILGGVLAPLSLFFLLFNSWVTMSFMHWPSINLPSTRVGDFIRMLSPWHVLHSYGIFFANSSPGVRWVPIIEGTDADIDATGDADASVRWEKYTYRFMQSSAHTRPPFVAPLHYRFDQSIFYDSVGMTPDTLFASLSSGNPYDYLGEGRTNLERVCQALLLDQDPGSPVEGLFANNPFPSQTRPVRALRVSLYLFQPTSWRDGSCVDTDEAGRTRTRYWTIKYVGQQAPGGPMTRRSLLARLLAPHNKQPMASQVSVKASAESEACRRFFRLREPSAWHPDHVLWQRCTTMHARLTTGLEAQLRRATDEKLDLEAAVGLAEDYGQELDAAVYARFWNDFLPRVRALHRRMAASAQCALDMCAPKDGASTSPSSSATATSTAAANGPCRCQCQSCQFRNEWVSTARARGKDGAAEGPVLDWSAEVSALRESLFHGTGAGAFTPSDLFFFDLIIQRLTMLLCDRVLTLPNFWHGPGADEGRRQSEETEAAEREVLRKEKAAQQGCDALCACEKTASSGCGADRLPAPTLQSCFGLLDGPTGARASCAASSSTGDAQSQHLHLPSFFHMHLFLQHALLSCDSGAAFSALLVSPRTLLRYLPSFSLSTGLLALGLFQRDLLAFHASKARLARCITFPQQREHGGLLPGFLQLQFGFLPWQFVRRDKRGRPLEFLPADDAVRRPTRSDQHWTVDASALPDPSVNLD